MSRKRLRHVLLQDVALEDATIDGVAVTNVGTNITGVTASSDELNTLDNVTPGTVAVSKAVVVDASKNIGTFGALACVDLDAGTATGDAGSIDIFPTTAARGKFSLTCTDQTGNTTVTLNADAMGQASTFHLADPGAADAYLVTATAALTIAEADVIQDVPAGTVTASKAVVVDASKDVGDFRNLDCVNLDAGASGTAGTVDVFPATGSRGKLAITCANQTGDTTVTLVADAMADARSIHIPDPGAAAGYVAMSTAALALAEVDVLQDVAAGTVAASKAVVVSADKDAAAFRNVTVTNLDAGAATGTAGSVDVFPAGPNLGKLSLTCTNQTGNTAVTVNADAMGQATTVHLADPGAANAYVALSTAALSLAEVDVLQDTPAGTATANKAAILGATKNLDTLVVPDLNVGASGTAGTVDIFPTTGLRGKFTLSCTNQTGDTTVTLNANAMGQGTTVNIPDPGVAASYLVQSTAALALAEVDVLQDVVAGTASVNKAAILGATKNLDTLVVPNFDAGASGTVGTVDVFPATPSRGKFTLACTDQTGDTAVTLNADAMGQATTVHLADPGAAAAYVALSTAALTLAEVDVLQDTPAGTVTASRAVVVSADKDAGDFRNLDCVNLDAGASGTAGTVDVFPATLSRGKLSLTCTDQTGDTAVTLNANAMGQATTVNIPDPGAAASYLVQSTAALTLAKVDVLQTLTASAAELNKCDNILAAASLVVAAEVTFTETAGAGTYTGTVTVPAEGTMLDLKIRSPSLWDNDTSAILNVGDGDDPDGWFTGIDLRATDLLVGEEISLDQPGGKQGVYLDNTTGKRSQVYSAAQRTIIGTITTTGATGTAGRTRMLVIYVTPTATAATKA